MKLRKSASGSLAVAARRLLGRLPVLVFCTVACIATGAERPIRLTTWNLNWFPNEKGPQESPIETQNARISAAADVLRTIDPDILLLQEVKDWNSCLRLAEAINPHTYEVAVCSAFREGGHIGKQQVAILSKEPAQAAWSEPWKSVNGIEPPRGFAFAWLKIRGADVGVYSVHLKSNRLARRDDGTEKAENVKKREVSAKQLLSHIHEVVFTAMPRVNAIIVGGDFNTNVDQFANDQTIGTLTKAGFTDCMGSLPLKKRVTHPGSGRYPDTTFDYFFALNASIGSPQITRSAVSDHLPVTCEVVVNSRLVPSRPTKTTDDDTSATAQSVTLREPVEIQIAYGKTTIPKGLRLPVVRRDTKSVWVRYMDGNYAVPVQSIDLR